MSRNYDFGKEYWDMTFFIFVKSMHTIAKSMNFVEFNIWYTGRCPTNIGANRFEKYSTVDF